MTQVEVNNADDSPDCHDCPVCPAGKAPSHRCGEKISPEDLKNLHCSDCAPGKTYSSTEDTSPCHECFETCPKDQVVIQNCSLTADMKCGVVKCDQGFYHDNSTSDCQECSWCCGDGRDDKKAECTERGMPKERSCSVHQKFRCLPSSTTKPTESGKTPATPGLTPTAAPTKVAHKPKGAVALKASIRCLIAIVCLVVLMVLIRKRLPNIRRGSWCKCPLVLAERGGVLPGQTDVGAQVTSVRCE